MNIQELQQFFTNRGLIEEDPRRPGRSRFVTPFNDATGGYDTYTKITPSITDDVPLELLPGLVGSAYVLDTVRITNGSNSVHTYVNIYEETTNIQLCRAFCGANGGGFSDVLLQLGRAQSTTGKKLYVKVETIGANVCVDVSYHIKHSF